jgi:hypothetical protein
MDHGKKAKDRITIKTANGICQKCTNKATEGRSLCKKCMDGHKKRAKKRFDNKRAHGNCLSCPDKAILGSVHCEKCRVKNRDRHQKLRDEVFSAYGGYKCSCECGCSESTPKCLTLDHVQNDGSAHKKRIGSSGAGGRIYKDLRKNNYPPIVKVLCWNCNCGRATNGGKCPKLTV